MKPIDHLFTEIAREELGIETLGTRNRDSLDFHDVSVRCVKDALLAAYQAGLRAASAPGPFLLLQDMSLAMHEGGKLKPKGWLARIEHTITEALAAKPLPTDASADLPIVIISVRGGCVQTVEATARLRVILEDWDCEDHPAGRKPYRAELPLTGELSSKKAARRLGRL